MKKIEKVELNLAGRVLSFETGHLAPQANGSIIARLGDTVVIATCTMSETAREGTDFFPLSVDYEEKFYATGKIKGSRFIKREGRPSENAILVSRLIDRPLRPLFPKKMRNDVQILCTPLSADMEVEPDITAINAASAAVCISGLPFDGPVGAVKIGYIVDSEGKNQLIVNPTYEQCIKGMMELVVAGTTSAITMVEAAAKEVPEEVILDALTLAHKHIKEICKAQLELKAKINKPAVTYTEILTPEEVKTAMKSFIKDEDLDAINGTTKAEIKSKLHALENKITEKFKKEIEDEKFKVSDLKEALKDLLEKRMRQNILEKEIRIDGRKLSEIRVLNCVAPMLPRTHGSALFERGETQALTITTLGSPGSAQIVDNMDEDTVKRYMHHYNFPPFSTGEVKMMRGTSRREIGHGDLAERALIPVLPDQEKFPYTMRVVSEILSCNGSSSMASVCASTLSLMDAGVPIKKPVSGIAMGLVTDGKGGYKILTDIQGMEDFAGDMDFKATGTTAGITALQMDIKVKGLSIEIMNEALQKAKEGRSKILEAMLACIPEPRKELSKYAPLIISYRIDPDQIRTVIGKGGETIQKIIADTGVEIDIEDEGLVIITAPNQEKGQQALDIVKKITYIPKVGDIFDGKVVKIMEFGAFIEIAPGKDGLCHISQLDKNRVNRVEDVVKLGDTIKVKLMEIDAQGRYNLSHKAVQ